MTLEEWLAQTPALALKALADRPTAHAAKKEQVIALILRDPQATARAEESKRIHERLEAAPRATKWPAVLNAPRPE